MYNVFSFLKVVLVKENLISVLRESLFIFLQIFSSKRDANDFYFAEWVHKKEHDVWHIKIA